MKHTLAALLLIPFSAMAMQQSPVSISKQSFHALTLKTWDQLNAALVNAAPHKKIELSTGLAAVVNEMHTQKAAAILDDQQVITRANELLPVLITELSKFTQEQRTKYTPAECTKLALTALLKEGLATQQQKLQLPAERTEEKIISAGEQAFTDNLEFMELNSHLDAKKCSTDFKAFMTVYFYLSQQN